MKIAFFGYQNSFDYDKIGGTNSLVRRISLELIQDPNIIVDHVIYGAEYVKSENNSGITSNYYKEIKDAFEILKDYDHVVTMYIPPRDFVKYALFRLQHRSHTYFHIIYTDWPISLIKRNALFAFNALVKYNGVSFGISPRIFKLIRKWMDSTVFLLPPVPEGYFISPKDKKNSSDKLTVTFIGRVDVGKGVLDVIDVYKLLANEYSIDLKFYGIHWREDLEAVKIHEELLNQDLFDYICLDFNNYSYQVDIMVQDVLRDTDIFLQPYKKLSSSIDMPLLILEAMAALCVVITRPYGDIPTIYGESVSLVSEEEKPEKIVHLIKSARQWLPKETERINNQNKNLRFDTHSVTEKFLKSILNIERTNNES